MKPPSKPNICLGPPSPLSFLSSYDRLYHHWPLVWPKKLVKGSAYFFLVLTELLSLFQSPMLPFLGATPQGMIPDLPMTCFDKIMATDERPMIKNPRKGFGSPIFKMFSMIFLSASHCCRHPLLPAIGYHHSHLLSVLQPQATISSSIPYLAKKKKEIRRRKEK